MDERVEGAKFENITFGIRAEGLGLSLGFRDSGLGFRVGV